MIFRSTNSIPSRSCIWSSKSFWSDVAMASRSASESRVAARLLSNRPNVSSSSRSSLSFLRFGEGDSLDALDAFSKLALSSSSILRFSTLDEREGFLQLPLMSLPESSRSLLLLASLRCSSDPGPKLARTSSSPRDSARLPSSTRPKPPASHGRTAVSRTLFVQPRAFACLLHFSNEK